MDPEKYMVRKHVAPSVGSWNSPIDSKMIMKQRSLTPKVVWEALTQKISNNQSIRAMPFVPI